VVPCQCLHLHKNIVPLTFRPKHLQTSASKGCLVNGRLIHCSWAAAKMDHLVPGSGSSPNAVGCCRTGAPSRNVIARSRPSRCPWGRRENWGPWGTGWGFPDSNPGTMAWLPYFFFPPTEQYYSWLVVWNMNFIVHNIWDNPSHWLICFKMVKTTNQIKLHIKMHLDSRFINHLITVSETYFLNIRVHVIWFPSLMLI